MPVRSSGSSVLKWPEARAVHEALRGWAATAARSRPQLARVGYVGSYARGDWGPGSDLDVLLVLDGSDLPPLDRALEWDLTALPVPADLLVYTEDEIRALVASGTRFGQAVAAEAVWVFDRSE